MAGPYNIKEDVEEGDPEHPEHHQDLAKAVNDLDHRVTDVSNDVAQAVNSAESADNKATDALSAANTAQATVETAVAAAESAWTAATQAENAAEMASSKADMLANDKADKTDTRFTDPREPSEESAAGENVGWVRGIFRNTGDTLPAGLPADTLVIERP